MEVENQLKIDDFLLSVFEEEPTAKNPYILASKSKKLFINRHRCRKTEKTVENAKESVLVWKEFMAEADQICHNEAYDFVFGHLFGDEFYSDGMVGDFLFEFEETSEEKLEISTRKSSPPKILVKDFWEETFVLHASLVQFDPSLVQFSLCFHSLINNEEKRYSGGENRHFQVSALFLDSSGEILSLKWKTIKPKEKLISFPIENLDSVHSIELRQASVKLNGPEISYGRSNKIFIDGHSELQIAGIKIEKADEVVNAHKKIQLSFSNSARIPLLPNQSDSFTVFGSYSQPNTTCSHCRCSLAKSHDFIFQSNSSEKFVDWKIDEKKEPKEVFIWSSTGQNGNETICGPVHKMKIDSIALEITMAGIFFSIFILSVAIFACLFRYVKKVKRKTKCQKPKIIIYEDDCRKIQKDEKESELLDILPESSNFIPVNLQKLIWGMSSSESSLEEISSLSSHSANNDYVDFNFAM
ncbi:Oidioi.mRNA.OKI2018_I69.chr1.g272.t1.cds [Oikopleura dioica]|uniref:Oidioi.mRNA.OKI2018_I69.chr1.g272.t1.cds n=1 Tax=Oikopleura dioica TaxID=34765 RepID=A0ABN7SJC7_OIKDI|nr:Oidioi.mRNA.OKI2018_I69.chr1.g272.t1.cds [Oikopleura dioica]